MDDVVFGLFPQFMHVSWSYELKRQINASIHFIGYAPVWLHVLGVHEEYLQI